MGIRVRRRSLFRLLWLSLTERLAAAATRTAPQRPKVVVAKIGGVRRQETFSPEGAINIPHLSKELISHTSNKALITNVAPGANVILSKGLAHT